MSYKIENTCRISNSSNLYPIFDLGQQPLANTLKTRAEDIVDTYPLSISFCHDTKLIQLDQTVDKSILFKNYVWVTGTSNRANKWAEIFLSKSLKMVNLNSEDFILEIASNDGTFLKPFLAAGYENVLGVEPAKNLTLIAKTNGVPTINMFWNSSLAKDLRDDHGLAKFLFARNVIPHVSEILDVVQGMGIILHERGVGAIEFHYAGKILEELQYDSIYHEHLCYFSLYTITLLLNQFGLHPFHVIKSPISGGALVLFFSRYRRNESADLLRQIESENRKGINDLQSWISFSTRANEHRSKTRDAIDSYSGKVVVGFGSSARSQTFLNYCGIQSTNVAAIIDNNPLKHGLYAPGNSIPIVPIDHGIDIKPDLIFILAWNFFDEIVSECRKLGYGGRFLAAFPFKPYFTSST